MSGDISHLAKFGGGGKVFIPSGMPQRVKLSSVTSSFSDVVNLPAQSGIVTNILSSVSNINSDAEIELNIDSETSTFLIVGATKLVNEITGLMTDSKFHSTAESAYYNNAIYTLPFTESLHIRHRRAAGSHTANTIVYYQLGKFVDLG